MASLFYRGDRVWLRYQTEDGKWHSKATGLRKSNAGELRTAQRARDKQTLRERIRRAEYTLGTWDFVEPWILTTWGHSLGTLNTYQKHWREFQRYLNELNLPGPANVQREHCVAYPQWREKHGGKRNTAIHELKFFAQVLDEAIERRMTSANPARKLGLKRAPVEQKPIWSDTELDRVDADLDQRDKFGWMRGSFLLGRFQAARLRQCAVPLHCIDLDRKVVTYPDEIVKGRKGFTQALDDRVLPALREIIEHRRAIGSTVLCEFPQFPSLDWREYLDRLGYPHLVHHSLRRTSITKAALAGIPESVAQRFSNHDSSDVHRLYMRFTAGDMASMLARLQ